MRQFNRKAVYVVAVAIILAVAAGLFLISDRATVSAQKGDLASRGETRAKVATPDMLAFALRFGTSADYTVFGAKGVRGDGASVTGKSGTGTDEASLGENGSGLKARSDLNKAMSMTKQLPCIEMGAELTGGTFAPGVYCAPSAALAGQMVLDAGGDENGRFVFLIEGSMKSSDSFQMDLANGTRAGNVYFLADTASLGAWNSMSGSVIARGTVTVGEGTTVKGRAISKEGEVILADGANLALAPGYIQICKYALHDGVARSNEPGITPGYWANDTGTSNTDITGPVLASLANRIFRFSINGGPAIQVPVGGCSQPIQVNDASATVEELTSGYYTHLPQTAGNTWENRFRLVHVSARTATGSLAPSLATDLRTRRTMLSVPTANNQSPVILDFTNTFAIPAVIEICKHSANSITTQTGAASPATLGASVPINDTAVQGTFDFTVNVIQGSVFSVPVGFCSGPIFLDPLQNLGAPTTPQTFSTTNPATAAVYVSEITNPGFTLETMSAFGGNGANRQLGTSFGNQITNNIINPSVTDPCAITTNPSVAGFPPANCVSSNIGGGYQWGSVYENSTAANQTIFTFFNRTNPGLVKLCKVAGPGIPIGTRFRFEVRGRAPSNPFPGPYLPGIDVIRFVDVSAGPPEQGGFCSFVDGTFIVGTNVLVTEVELLDPVSPVAKTAPSQFESVYNLQLQAVVNRRARSGSVAGETEGGSVVASNSEPISYQEFLYEGRPYTEAFPPGLASGGDDQPGRIDFRSTIKSGWPDATTLALAGPQPAILGATSTSNRAVVFPDPGTNPATQSLVPGLPAGAQPHGVGYYGSDNALISDFSNSRIFDVKISTASLVSTINTAGAGYDGTGTIAVAPNLSTALAMGSSNSLKVIQGPFGPASVISSLTLPGSMAGYQTQAIVFNNAGRAFVYHTSGITVLDAPYTSIAFTIPVTNLGSGAIAISPDGNTLLATDLSTNQIKIFQAPFSAGSTATALTVPGGVNLDGIMAAPNGAHAIVVSASAQHAASIAAPFTPASTVETLPLPAGSGGFEDVGISADSQLAMLTGNSTTLPAVLIAAPFTAGGATSAFVPIVGVTNQSRGNGAVRFLPPGLAPGLTISKTAPATVPSGATLTYTINYSNTGTTAANGVVITDPLPAGTSFVSATGGGTLQGGDVVFIIGTLDPGDSGSVTFTVTVNTASGGSVENNGFTIEGDGITPIPGAPVTTAVTAPDIVFNISKIAAATVQTGTNLTYTINYQNTGSSYALNVVIRDPLPAGTSFVSATNGGTLVAGNVVFDLGTVNAGANGSVSFTVAVNTPSGGTVTNSNYTIAAAGVGPTTGQPVSTLVTASAFPDFIRVSRITSNCTLAAAPVAVQGITVNPNPSLTTRQIVFRAGRGECVSTFVNSVFQPTQLKICKIAGPGIPVGTPFDFTITTDTVGGLFNEGTQTVTVEAGPAEQGGFCRLVNGPYDPTNTTPPNGTFRVGARVTVTESPSPGTNITSITSPTGTPALDLPNRRATLTLGFPGGFNELIFTNSNTQGLESDIGNRFTGDGSVLTNDVIFLRLFAVGLLVSNPAYNEFQRADAAPRNSLGDALISSGDVIQARRYAAGIDPLTPAGGPIGPIAPVVVESPLAALNNTGQRTIRAFTSTGCAGFNSTVAIMLNSEGSEAGAGFTVTFDPAVLSNPVVSLGKDSSERGFVLTTNPTNVAAGQIGILLDAQEAFPASPPERHLLNIHFQVVSGAPAGLTPIGFSGKTTFLSTSDGFGSLLETNYQPANVSVGGQTCTTSTGVTVSGRVLSPDGNGLRNATVTLTDSDGKHRTVITSSLGYYQIDDVRAGQMYVIGVSNKRYRFTSRGLQVSDTLSNVDFVGTE